MRDELVGYLLGALDPEEAERVEQFLRVDPEGRRLLEVLRRGLRSLEADLGHVDPPAGLAARTCRAIHARATRSVPSMAGTGRFRLQDMLVAAAVLMAATLLLFPAVNISRNQRDIVACANNLRTIGMALANYSNSQNGFFPYVAPDGRLAAAGIYGPVLIHTGFVTDPHVFCCPAERHDQHPPLPTLERLLQLSPDSEEFKTCVETMGGSYGYALGYRDSEGVYYGAQNAHRTHFAVLADQPARSGQSPTRPNSPNHGGAGQNVWYEDGHVKWVRIRAVGLHANDIFVNNAGKVAAGIGPNDSMIGFSEAGPNGF